MTEIDILKRSSFLWCDLLGCDHYFIAAGFEAWGGVFFKDGEWYALGGRKNEQPKLLATGERVVCFAAADDWLNLFETESAAHKTRSWLHQPATENQLRYLPPKYRNDFSLTRYKATSLKFGAYTVFNIRHGLMGNFVAQFDKKCQIPLHTVCNVNLTALQTVC